MKLLTFNRILCAYIAIFVFCVSCIDSLQGLKNTTYKLLPSTGIYVWSNEFRENSNQMLLEYVQSLTMNQIYLSVGPDDSLLEKATDFIASAKQQDVNSHLLVGNNTLINPRDQSGKLQSYAENAVQLGATGVHLNVEPHTFDDWDERRERYEQQYIDLVIAASSLFESRNLSLSISIPHFYDPIVSRLEPYAHRIIVMVYETTDVEVLKGRIELEGEELGEKLYVAIRPSDFENMEQVNIFVQQVLKQTAAQKVILHDISSLLKLDSLNV